MNDWILQTDLVFWSWEQPDQREDDSEDEHDEEETVQGCREVLPLILQQPRHLDAFVAAYCLEYILVLLADVLQCLLDTRYLRLKTSAEFVRFITVHEIELNWFIQH